MSELCLMRMIGIMFLSMSERPSFPKRAILSDEGSVPPSRPLRLGPEHGAAFVDQVHREYGLPTRGYWRTDQEDEDLSGLFPDDEVGGDFLEAVKNGSNVASPRFYPVDNTRGIFEQDQLVDPRSPFNTRGSQDIIPKKSFAYAERIKLNRVYERKREILASIESALISGSVEFASTPPQSGILSQNSFWQRMLSNEKGEDLSSEVWDFILGSQKGGTKSPVYQLFRGMSEAERFRNVRFSTKESGEIYRADFLIRLKLGSERTILVDCIYFQKERKVYFGFVQPEQNDF